VPSINKAKASAIPVFSIVDEPSTLDIRKTGHRDVKTVERGKIEFIDCVFNYPTRAQKVMNHFNIEIPAGAKIALVGHSGCGKSTLTNILLRFYDINSGKVLIDGKDLDRYDVHALRQQCGYVMQEPVLFNANIKTNIRFGKPEATDEEVYIAAQKANCLAFIEGTTENLTDAQKLEQLEHKLDDLFAEAAKTHPSLVVLKDTALGMSKSAKQLIVDLFSNINHVKLTEIAAHVDMVQTSILKTVNKYGASWEDILIHFEWSCALKATLAGAEISEHLKSVLREMVDKYMDLEAGFDEQTLKRAQASGLREVEALAEMVRREMPAYRMTVVNKRFNELQLMAIDKKRDDKGIFVLPQGFDKDCGLKGGKLSGG